MSFTTILFSPPPVWSSDNSITDVFHLNSENAEKADENREENHPSSSFLRDIISYMCYLFVPSALSANLDLMSVDARWKFPPWSSESAVEYCARQILKRTVSTQSLYPYRAWSRDNMEDIMICEDDLLTLWSTDMVSSFVENIFSYVVLLTIPPAIISRLNMKVGVLKRFP